MLYGKDAILKYEAGKDMESILLKPSSKIYVTKSDIPNAGRGVFAAQAIDKDEIIESCPVIKVSLTDPSNNNRGSMVDYFFYFEEDLAIALGYGSIYNHSYNPNATYQINPDTNSIDFFAIRPIAAEEEITVNYNFGKPDDTTQPNVRGVPSMESANR